ncbi:MAG: hypothetical protein E7Z72_00405 [Methanocorpusculum parvum]|nr:hypothetical protein [Methanocorpusculum parvum]
MIEKEQMVLILGKIGFDYLIFEDGFLLPLSLLMEHESTRIASPSDLLTARAGSRHQNESRAYTRLLFRLIAGSRGTLTPSQSARAEGLDILPYARADCEGVSDRVAVPR